MNSNCFSFLMGAVDDDLLEEAQRPVKKHRPWLWISGAAAACVVAAVSVWCLRNGPSFLPNPTYEDAYTEIQRLGYSLPVPSGAEDISYTIIDSSSSDMPVAEVSYKSGGQCYFCRALKTPHAKDISGMDENWTESLSWEAGSLQMRMCQSDTNAWVGWYASDVGMQWCLGGEGDALSLLHTAQSLLETLGYGVATAPEGAEDIVYNAFELDGLTVGETTFVLDGIAYSYRVARTWDLGKDFADISGMERSFGNEAVGELMWCPARLSYDDRGAGKIVWFDVVPGLLYSLSMDQEASEEALLTMAGQLFAPAQGESGE